MTDSQIISIQLPIECIEEMQNVGYLYLKANYPNLVNYNETIKYKIVDNFSLVMNKFRGLILGKV